MKFKIKDKVWFKFLMYDGPNYHDYELSSSPIIEKYLFAGEQFKVKKLYLLNGAKGSFCTKDLEKI